MQPRIEVIVVGSITAIVEAGITVAASKVIDPLVASLATLLLASSWVVAAWRFACYFGGGRPRALPAFAIYDNICSIQL